MKKEEAFFVLILLDQEMSDDDDIGDHDDFDNDYDTGGRFFAFRGDGGSGGG